MTIDGAGRRERRRRRRCGDDRLAVTFPRRWEAEEEASGRRRWRRLLAHRCWRSYHHHQDAARVHDGRITVGGEAAGRYVEAAAEVDLVKSRGTRNRRCGTAVVRRNQHANEATNGTTKRNERMNDSSHRFLSTGYCIQGNYVQQHAAQTYTHQTSWANLGLARGGSKAAFT